MGRATRQQLLTAPSPQPRSTNTSSEETYTMGCTMECTMGCTMGCTMECTMGCMRLGVGVMRVSELGDRVGSGVGLRLRPQAS